MKSLTIMCAHTVAGENIGDTGEDYPTECNEYLSHPDVVKRYISKQLIQMDNINYRHLSSNPFITMKDVLNNTDKDWDWRWLSSKLGLAEYKRISSLLSYN